jgi:hypothetical protein
VSRSPYQNEREACAAARAVIPPEPGWSILSRSQRAELLLCALSDAGVETSTFEYGTAWWLCGWEDHVTAIIARWVAGAFEAGKAAGPDGAVTEWGVRQRNLSGQGEYVATYGTAGDHARSVLPYARDGVLVRREVTPWAPVPVEGES